MPRSVNHVASRAKRKRILKLTRGYFGARKNVWTVAKNTFPCPVDSAYQRCRSSGRYELFSPDGSSLKGWHRDQP